MGQKIWCRLIPLILLAVLAIQQNAVADVPTEYAQGWVIVPGESYGPFRLGMSRNEVQKESLKLKFEVWREAEYWHFFAAQCSVTLRFSGPVLANLAGNFPATVRGLPVGGEQGATKEQILAVLGPPDDDAFYYYKLGIGITINGVTGRASTVVLFPPRDPPRR